MNNNNNEDYKGYRGTALESLQKFNVKVWSEVTIDSERGTFNGVILPRSETADADHIVLKLSTGYNIGVRADTVHNIIEIGYKKGNYKIPEKDFPVDPKKPYVTLLGTGGTIASRLDYRTGAVIPAFSPGELYGAVPELADICNLNTRKLFGIFSENMGREQYITLATEIEKEIQKGVDGIVIGHGTDTMHHTASVLTFMVQNPPVPIIIVGSQRSSDRPSSDAAMNLIHATTAAAFGDIAEVLVCMYGVTSDNYGLLHRGTRVRKMHSSYRSTFRTLGDIPMGTVTREGVKPLRSDYSPRRHDHNVKVTPTYSDKVTILYYYPNMQPNMIDMLVENGYKGIVIAGTGLGHVNQPLYDPIKRATAAGVQIYMTVQTLWGFAQMFVYETGRDLMDRGVVPLNNMLPEVAYMKLAWALGQTEDREEVKKIMLTPIKGDMTLREPPDGYLILQGGLPEADEFLKKYFK